MWYPTHGKSLLGARAKCGVRSTAKYQILRDIDLKLKQLQNTHRSDEKILFTQAVLELTKYTQVKVWAAVPVKSSPHSCVPRYQNGAHVLRAHNRVELAVTLHNTERSGSESRSPILMCADDYRGGHGFRKFHPIINGNEFFLRLGRRFVTTTA